MLLHEEARRRFIAAKNLCELAKLDPPELSYQNVPFEGSNVITIKSASASS